MARIDQFKEVKLGKKLASRTLENYGYEWQLRLLQEECAELIQAINHFFRQTDGAKDELIEELCDVSIVREQILYALEEDSYSGIYQPGQYNNAFELKKMKLEERLSCNLDRLQEEPQWD